MRSLLRLSNLLSLVVAVAATVACSTGPEPPPDSEPQPPASDVEILRDTYGVPHIFTADFESAAYAWGYVSAEDGRDGHLAMLYAGVGRSAEFFGPDCGALIGCSELDAVSRMYKVSERVAEGYDQLQPTTRLALEAYAAGVNRFYDEHPEQELSLPVTGEMVAASVVTTLTIVRAMSQSQFKASDLLATLLEEATLLASNQFAVTGTRTPADTSIAGSDPHSPWRIFPTQPYVHIHIPGKDIVGANYFPGPTLECGGNSNLVFGCTTLSAATVVGVEAELGPGGDSYFDHAVGDFVPFEQETVRFEVKGEGTVELELLFTRFGPVFERRQDSVVAVQIFAAGDVGILDYEVGRLLVDNDADYQLLFDRERPAEVGQNRTFATADHDIGYFYAAYLPELDDSLDWSQIQSSADPRIEWEQAPWYNLDGEGVELPHVINPQGDLVQNCNGHPGYSTLPADQIPLDVPRHLANQNGPSTRGERLLPLLDEKLVDTARAEEMLGDIRMWQAELFIEALRRGIVAEGIDPAGRYGDDAGALFDLLLSWRDEGDGYQAHPDSEAMTVYFHLWDAAENPTYPEPGATAPLSALDDFGASLDALAASMRNTYKDLPDPLRVPWGYVNRVVIGGVEYGLPGAPAGQTLWVSAGLLQADGRMDPDPSARFGSSMVRVATFGPDGLEVRVAFAQGQLSETVFPDSSHIGQTTPGFVDRQLRRLWLDRDEIEANLCPFAEDDGHEHPATLVLAGAE